MKRYLLDCEDEVFTLIMLAVDFLMLPLIEILDRIISFQQTSDAYRIEVVFHDAQ